MSVDFNEQNIVIAILDKYIRYTADCPSTNHSDGIYLMGVNELYWI